MHAVEESWREQPGVQRMLPHIVAHVTDVARSDNLEGVAVPLADVSAVEDEGSLVQPPRDPIPEDGEHELPVTLSRSLKLT